MRLTKSKVVPQANQHDWWRLPLLMYLGWRFWLIVVATLALRYWPLHPMAMRFGFIAKGEFGIAIPDALMNFGNFDGVVFMRIARGGYGGTEVPFFPLLPMLMSALHDIGLPFILGGLFTSLVALLIALPALRNLLKLDGLQTQPALSQFWLLLLTFPTAFYFTAVYQDALFFTATVYTIWFVRRRHWLAAVLAAVLASLARLNGVALFFYLGAEYMIAVQPLLAQTWGWRSAASALIEVLQPRQLRRHPYVWLFLAVPLTLVAYLVYIELKLGDWRLFFTGVEVWNRDHLTFPLQTAWRYFKILILYARFSYVYWIAWSEALFTLWYALFLWRQWGKLRFSYWILALLHWLIPVLTGTLQGMPRYGLHLYPFFLVLTAWWQGQTPWARRIYLLIMILIQTLYLSYFIRGFFVA